jgi:excisionase family DNA binding protein
MEQIQKLVLDTEEVSRVIGIRRTKLLELTYSGEIPSFKIGRSRRYYLPAIERWLQQQANPGNDAQ